ncbi:MAG: hypothetical protein L0228_10070 [Planctomycetes bacterium]|nr:hypothetical protein [Planctomycetota bacterium]
MARRYIKSVLHAGQTYHSPDGEVTPTPERLKHWRDGFAKLTAAKYNVPVDWDHADTLDKLQPVKMAEQKKRRSAKNTVGELAKLELAKDGKSALLTVELTDPVAQGRAERNEVYVSPVILDKWKDGHGTEYADLITHVDLVNHPVDHSQGPFREALPAKEPGVVALALRMGLGKPAAIRMADNPFEEKDGDGDGEAGEGDETAEAAKPENQDMPADDSTAQEAEAIVAHLAQLGVVLPADWSFKAEAAGQILLAALKTANHATQQAEAEKAEAERADDDTETGDTTVADPGYAAMSLDAKRALAFAEKTHRGQIRNRLDALLANGRCTADEHTKRTPLVAAIKLSLDDKGEPTPDDLEKWIESREAVPAGTFWDDKAKTANQKRMSLEVAKPPKGFDRIGDDLTDEEASATANWALGRKPAAAAK